MNYQFADEVRFALTGALGAANTFGHDYVGTEHILLGLLEDALVVEILASAGASRETLRASVIARMPRSSAPAAAGASRPAELPYTSHARKVLSQAMAEARLQGSPLITTRHLLAGVAAVGKGIAYQALADLGITIERLRGLLPPERVLEQRGPLRVRIDDASDRSIYEQIVAQVTEAVAIGRLRPGDRLMPVRQQADELDVAPGTVARAYSELERQGIVITEGARGTRVAERVERSQRVLDGTETLEGLLRPVAVAAFHLGATAPELRQALEVAMRGIFDKNDEAA